MQQHKGRGNPRNEVRVLWHHRSSTSTSFRAVLSPGWGEGAWVGFDIPVLTQVLIPSLRAVVQHNPVLLKGTDRPEREGATGVLCPAAGIFSSIPRQRVVLVFLYLRARKRRVCSYHSRQGAASSRCATTVTQASPVSGFRVSSCLAIPPQPFYISFSPFRTLGHP